MDVGVQRREEQVCGQADGCGGSVEFVQEALIPGVDAVLEHFPYSLKETIFAMTRVW